MRQPMRLPTSPVFVASLCLAACGGEPLAGSTPQDGATQTRAIIGPVDLTTAPATLGLTCPDAAAALAFKMPCLVGMNLAGTGHPEPGSHATECRMAQS